MSVTLETSLGDIKIELECGIARRNCENFLALCATNYYDGTLFHRNIAGFLVQGGDPTNKGKGGESIFGAENPISDEFSQELKHDRRGVVSMANTGKDTNASQFFITYARQPQLDDQYTAIGRVIHGFEVLDKMESAPVKGKKFKPLEPITLKHVIIHANPIADAAAQ